VQLISLGYECGCLRIDQAPMAIDYALPGVFTCLEGRPERHARVGGR
jgi:hypothetical protein